VRGVDLVCEVFVVDCFAAASAALDRALDIVAWHVCRPALQQDHPKPRIHSGISSRDLSGDRDLFPKLRKYLPALGVDSTFEVLHLRPFAVTGHSR